MANLGNVWHIPGNPEPRGRAGMRDPIGAIVPGTAVTIFSGNQFQGGGNPGNQLQDGSTLFFKRAADSAWIPLPMTFGRELGNNKYYSATIPANTFQTGDTVQYYLRIAYDDHDTTFLSAQNGVSTPTADEADARAVPFAYPVESSASKGQWGPVFSLPNVAIHTHVLPNGTVLMWGRRDRPKQSLDIHECTPFLWNPVSGTVTNTPQPKPTPETTVNLFCAGHTFLPDGRLLVVGGHLADSDGVEHAMLYDWATNTWAPTANMGKEMRRWYPTATSLPDGTVLVLSGSYIDPALPANQNIVTVDTLQVWENGAWKTIKTPDGGDLNFIGLPLYPRMHVASDGRVFMAGSNAQTYLLKTNDGGTWTPLPNPGGSRKKERQYAPSVMYDVDKVIYIGGGNDAPPPQQPDGPTPPTAAAEVIDLSSTPPRWRATQPMHFRRRHHNATLLPDGTVLVTGGTRGGGPPDKGFNDLAPGQPVHIAELWDPGTEIWTELAAEEVDRCYHATAVLLPDATVLSAGGGEYKPGGQENPPEDSHRDAQIFSPPYLFKGNRPAITSAPTTISYGETFPVGTAEPSEIGRVSWVRLPSVTHAFDENQRINLLPFRVDAGVLLVTAPDSANVCPPGHYMLFILSRAGVPSTARIVQIQAPVALADVAAELHIGLAATGALAPDALTLSPVLPEPEAHSQLFARRAEVVDTAKGTAVVVGVTGTCPYGIGACWGGAYEALHQLEGVELVNPIPNADDSTAEVFLEDTRLPALDRWAEQFRSVVGGSYLLRGVEVTLQGTIVAHEGALFLESHGGRPRVLLAPLEPADKIQWSQPARSLKPLDAGEDSAYERLAAASSGLAAEQRATVTGPLQLVDTGYQLHVRLLDL